MWDKTTTSSVSIFFLIMYKENILTILYLRRILPVHKNPTTEAYNLHSFSRTYSNRETKPLNLVYWLLTERNSYFLVKAATLNTLSTMLPSVLN